MSHHIFRSIVEPKRKDLSWVETWKGADKGIIASWERGREKAKEDAELAACARRGELPILVWKGGVEKKIKAKKYGTLQYLAQWQALRGEDLDIHTNKEVEIVCSKTGMTVIYTADMSKYSEE
jgi:hypothetical protein